MTARPSPEGRRAETGPPTETMARRNPPGIITPTQWGS